MLAKYISNKMIKGEISFFIIILVNLIRIKRNILCFKKGNFRGLLNIEQQTEYNISKENFHSENKKNGVSLFARLKNAEEFLEITIESHINYYDEIILVDNNSEDSTELICRNLQKKYPNKIKFYIYPFEVYGLGHEKWDITPENSVHSLSYYYNWTLSKTNYKYVSKLDDDVLLFNEQLIKEKIKNIKMKGLDHLEIIPQLNVNLIQNKIKTPIKGISHFLPIIAGLYCDHGIFPISEKTYFIKSKIMESFIFPFGIKINKLGFFHLKGLKKCLGSKNQHGNMSKLIFETNKQSEYINLPEYYLKILNKKLPLKDFL